MCVEGVRPDVTPMRPSLDDDRQLVLRAGEREADLAVLVGEHRTCGQRRDQLRELVLVEPVDIVPPRRGGDVRRAERG